MDKPACAFTPSEWDDEMKIWVSPEKLAVYRGEGPCAEIDAAFEVLDLEPSAEEFYRAIGVLVFHARHLQPNQHADLASIVSTPYLRPAGKPRNAALHIAADHFIAFRTSSIASESEESFLARAPKQFKTTKEIARRAIRAAERRQRSSGK